MLTMYSQTNIHAHIHANIFTHIYIFTHTKKEYPTLWCKVKCLSKLHWKRIVVDAAQVPQLPWRLSVGAAKPPELGAPESGPGV